MLPFKRAAICVTHIQLSMHKVVYPQITLINVQMAYMALTMLINACISQQSSTGRSFRQCMHFASRHCLCACI